MLNFFGDLRENSEVLLRDEGLVLVVLPLVLHVRFDLGLEALVHRGPAVEVLHRAEEQEEVLFFFQVLVDFVDLRNHLDELIHNVGENGDAEEEEQRPQKHLDLSLWAEVAEADGRQRREGEVYDFDHLLVV